MLTGLEGGGVEFVVFRLTNSGHRMGRMVAASHRPYRAHHRLFCFGSLVRRTHQVGACLKPCIYVHGCSEGESSSVLLHSKGSVRFALLWCQWKRADPRQWRQSFSSRSWSEGKSIIGCSPQAGHTVVADITCRGGPRRRRSCRFGLANGSPIGRRQGRRARI